VRLLGGSELRAVEQESDQSFFEVLRTVLTL